MNDLTSGIFVQKEILGRRLRLLEKIANCSLEEAVGLIIELWMVAAEKADETGRISPEENQDFMSDEHLEAFELSGLIRREDEAVILEDFDEIISPARILKEYDDKLDKKRHLDMLRKQRRRAELKAEKSPELPAEKPVEKPEPIDVQEPENADVVPPAPEKKSKRAEKPKKEYAEHVRMTEDQYMKLVTQYGQEAADECVAALNNYKGSKGRSYKDDYLAILSWVIDRVKEKKPGLFLQTTQPSEWHEENPF